MGDKCVFCGLDTKVCWQQLTCYVQCSNCGNYSISHKMRLAMPYYLENELSEQKHLISGYLREMTEMDLPTATITQENYHSIVDSSRVPTTIMEKLDKLLVYLYRKSEYLYQDIKIETNQPAVAYAKNEEEYNNMVGALVSLDFLLLKSQTKPYGYQLTLSGIQRAESLVRESVKSDQVFIAMWFDADMVDIYEKYISKGIEDAGYKALIIPMKEYNDSITDQILAEIRKSRFVVADFTGDRGGVYFEAGFAYGLNKPVIWTCKDDWFDKEVMVACRAEVEGMACDAKIKQIRKVHFDINHYNFIVWKNGEELRERLKNRILATIPKD